MSGEALLAFGTVHSRVLTQRREDRERRRRGAWRGHQQRPCPPGPGHAPATELLAPRAYHIGVVCGRCSVSMIKRGKETWVPTGRVSKPLSHAPPSPATYLPCDRAAFKVQGAIKAKQDPTHQREEVAHVPPWPSWGGFLEPPFRIGLPHIVCAMRSAPAVFCPGSDDGVEGRSSGCCLQHKNVRSLAFPCPCRRTRPVEV